MVRPHHGMVSFHRKESELVQAMAWVNLKSVNLKSVLRESSRSLLDPVDMNFPELADPYRKTDLWVPGANRWGVGGRGELGAKG